MNQNTLQSELRDTPDWDALVHAIEAGDDNGVDVALTETITLDRLDTMPLCELHGQIEDAASERVRAVIDRDCPDIEVSQLNVSLVGEVSVGMGGGKLMLGWVVRVRCDVRRLVA